ncbi:MAG: hypothetical protein JWO31_1723 [Phycisphaerales bacterium]|nr:hypothetical protein [Phycisphaerales bacterium]
MDDTAFPPAPTAASSASLLQDDAFLRRVLAASPDCIKVLDLDANLLAMNENGRRALEIGELTPHLGTCWTGWWQGPAREAATAAVAAANAGGTGRFEAAADTFGGTPKYWDVTVTAVPGPDGRPDRLLSVSRDITAQRVARDAAAERLDRLRSVVESAKDYAVISVAPDGRIDGWSTGAVATFGWAEADAVGQPFDLIWTPEDRSAGSPGRELRVAEDGGVAPDNRWHLRADGRRIFVVGACRPVRDAGGRLTGYVKVCRDETDRNRADARFRELADAMPQIVWAAGPDGVLDYYNRRWFDFVRRPAATDPAAADVRWDQFVHPDDLPRAGAAWAASVATGDPYTIEFRVRDGAGDYHWFLVRALPVRDGAGRVARWYGTCTDIDDRKAAEAERERLAEQRRMALNAADLGWWHLDPASGDVIFDAGFKAIFGVVADRLAYEQVIGLMHPDDRARVDAAVRAATRPDDPQAYAIDYRVIHPDGSARWVHATGRAYYDGEGAARRYTAFVGTVADVTDRVRADADRQALLDSERAARAEAERAGRTKDEFLATLSHELRTPLNAIVGWTQILKLAGGRPDDLAEGLGVIERNAKAQTQIIEDILDMSRIVSGKIRLDVLPVDLAALVRAGVETVRPAADAKSVRLQVAVDPIAGPVAGDPNRLHQVFWNLLSNAVKFTPKGGRVHVALGRVNSHVEVSVTDTGEGIDAGFLPHVFDRFRQADASTTRRHGGLGLGLAIVKQLVDLHGGSVRVSSPGPGRGSTFTVELPLTAVQPGDDMPAAAREHPGSEVEGGGHRPAYGQLVGVSVLVVDDEDDARTVVRRLLEGCGAVVDTAGSAGEALAHLTARVPDVLVSDIGMPGQDGYELIRRVRALPPDRGGRVHALALTAYARTVDRVRALEAGFHMHVAKPVDPAELIVTVAALARLAGAAIPADVVGNPR